MAGSVIDGEDILQETPVKALQALDGSVVVEKPEHWLFRIAHNAAQDHLRRRNRERSVMAEADISMVEDPTGRADSRHVAGASLRTFMHLSLAQRSAVILVDVLGLSLHETCDVTGATLAATKAALHRGRAQLRMLATAPEDAAPPTLDADDETAAAALCRPLQRTRLRCGARPHCRRHPARGRQPHPHARQERSVHLFRQLHRAATGRCRSASSMAGPPSSSATPRRLRPAYAASCWWNGWTIASSASAISAMRRIVWPTPISAQSAIEAGRSRRRATPSLSP